MFDSITLTNIIKFQSLLFHFIFLILIFNYLILKKKNLKRFFFIWSIIISWKCFYFLSSTEMLHKETSLVYRRGLSIWHAQLRFNYMFWFKKYNLIVQSCTVLVSLQLTFIVLISFISFCISFLIRSRRKVYHNL